MKTLPFALAVLAITLTSLCDAAVKNVVLVHGAFADGSGRSRFSGVVPPSMPTSWCWEWECGRRAHSLSGLG
jgi:hypothetical protein